MVIKIENETEKMLIAEDVLKQLPDWFGLPESTQKYIEDSRSMPFWTWKKGDSAQGFIVLKETSPYAAEIYVMGVLPEKHRRGIRPDKCILPEDGISGIGVSANVMG